MRVCIIDSKEIDIEKNMPGYLKSIACREKEVILGAVNEEGEIECYAMIQMLYENFEAASIDFIYTSPKCRGKNVASELINMVKRIFKGMGVKSLFMKLVGKPEYLKSALMFLTAQNFYPISLQGHILEFNLDKIANSYFIQKIDKLKEHMKEIKSIDEIPRDELKRMMGELLYRENYYVGKRLDKSLFDTKLSKLFIRDGRILGSIYIQKIDEKTLFILGTYATQEKEYKYVLPAVVGCALREVSLSYPIEDTKVLMQTFLNSGYNGMKEGFGEPNSDFVIHEYIKHLMTMEQDININKHSADIMTMEELKERFPKYDGKIIVPDLTPEEIEYYNKNIPNGEIYDKCLSSIEFRILSTYGMRKTVAFAKLEFGEKLTKQQEQDVALYRKETNAYLEQINMQTIHKDKPLSFFEKPNDYDSIDVKKMEAYLNRESVGWKDSELIFYFLQQLYDSRFSRTIEQNKKVLPKVESIADVYDERLQELMERVGCEELGFDDETLNLQYSKFYIKEEKIVACMAAEMPRDGLVIIRGYYISPGEKNNFIPGTLLWNILNEAQKSLGDESRVAFEIRKKEMLEYYTKVFGTGYKWLHVREEVSPEGMSIARVSENKEIENKNLDIEEDVLAKSDLDDLKKMAELYDDFGVVSFKEVVEILEKYYADNSIENKEKLINKCSKYYREHRGFRYAAIDRNRKRIVKRIMDVLE